MSRQFCMITVLVCLLIPGCAPYFNQPLRHSHARLGDETALHEDLVSLPAPKEKVVAAVYKFRDQTGQYKPSEVGASWSTAVTQGATSILLRALEQSGWFVTIEREGLSNLLNERKIIRSSRASYTKETNDLLPPLLFAGIILEGGIISYDANTMTGGAGARYLGAGGSAQYRQDRVTIYLRAISTTNGRILKTVYTSRTILSQKLDAGLFKFVSFQRLLEAETGFTYNEPTEIAVREAIEKAVQSLIIEGILDGLWSLQDPADLKAPAIAEYQAEAEENLSIDFLGRKRFAAQRGRVSIGGSYGAFRYAGDYPDPLYRQAYDINVLAQINPLMAIGLSVGQGTLAAENNYEETFDHATIRSIWRLYPSVRFTPLVQLDGGVMARHREWSSKIFPTVVGGLGAEYLIDDRISIQGSLNYHYLFSDELDLVEQGRYNDFFWSAKAGINIYLGKKIEN